MYDNVCKFLIEAFPTDFASWLLGEPTELTLLEPTELLSEPIRADSIVLLESKDTILHTEFQTKPNKDIPLRMADYCLRIHRRNPEKIIRQYVIYLTPSQSPEVYRTTFELPQMRHEFTVVRLWEQPTEPFLRQPGLLPFATLTNTEDRLFVLRQVSAQIQQLPDQTTRQNVAASAGILSTLLLEEALVSQILRQEIMQESALYQQIKAEGREEGREEGVYFMTLQ
ncbi:MAG: hypothetical protein AAGM27_04865, partial [Cyanobacteria bacterium J06554_3]